MRSRPARGAWVEIGSNPDPATKTESRPARGAWVEIHPVKHNHLPKKSRPARGAWVEINMGIGYELEPEVAPRKGRVG